MYQPKKYQKKDEAFTYKFIKNHPFASFILKGENLTATHIPVLTIGNVGNFKLFSHMANHNAMKEYLKDGAEGLFIFQGAHGYISSSWYKEKDISTWNYSAVHVNAKIKLQSRKELEDSLSELVKTFEESQEKPLYYKDIPQKMLQENLNMITGFYAEPFKIEAVAKLHQGYEKDEVESVIKNLGKKDSENKELIEDIQRENFLFRK